MIEMDGTNLVFILSTPRAGSTLLAAMLGNHSQAYAPPEPWLLLPLSTLYSPQAEITDTYEHFLARIAWGSYMENRIFDDAARVFALSVYNALLQKSKKTIFIDKTPRYFHILPWLEQLFPRAKKIWLRRNPLDVIASCKSTWGVSINEILGNPISPISFDNTIGFSLLAEFFFDNKDNHLSIKYEDFVQDSTQVLNALCNFLGLSIEPEMANYGANNEMKDTYTHASLGDKEVFRYTKPHTDSVMRWRKILTPQEVSSILVTLGQKIFIQHGYEQELDEAITWVKLEHSKISKNGNLESIFSSYHNYTENGKSNSPGKEQTHLEKDNTRLRKLLSDAESNFAVLRSDVQRLEQLLRISESDRTARLEIVQEQGRLLGILEGERNNLRFQMENLGNQLETSEIDRTAVLAIIKDQVQVLGTLEGERNNLRFQLEDLGRQFETSEADRAARLVVIDEQSRKLGELEAERGALAIHLEDIKLKLEKSDVICESQALVVEAQEHQIKIIISRLGSLQKTLQAIQHSRVYKVLRRFGKWGWLDNLISDSLNL